MDGIIPGILAAVRDSGPAGAVIAAAICGLTLAVILIARFKNLWSDSRSSTQVVGFQDRLLAALDKLMASEDALRRRIEVMEEENGLLRDEADELRASLHLLRSQRRRLVELLRDIRDGKVPAAGEVA